MKIVSVFRLFCPFAAVAFVVSTLGQPISPSGKAGLTSAAKEAAKERFLDGMGTVISQAKRGDAVAVENAVNALDDGKARPAQSHLHTAQRLIQAAGEAARNAQLSTAASLARKALQHLDQATQLAGTDVKLRIAAADLAGYINERYFGDLEQAKACYQTALKLDPSTGRAKEALERLIKADVPRQSGGGL
jgi:tetratricopeptide (TPR) repeat protein